MKPSLQTLTARRSLNRSISRLLSDFSSWLDMKVQCDVCDEAQATVMCCADEAALCSDCDTRVHAANKLASKHQRVPLLYPAPEESPSCDICQEKTGYFFCVEDRALLCRSCDFSIHSANTLASKHKRFLVTGIRVALAALSGQDRVPSADDAPTLPQPALTQSKSSRLPSVVNNAPQSASSLSQQTASLRSNSSTTQVTSLSTNSAMQQAASLCLPAQQVFRRGAAIAEALNPPFRGSSPLQQIPVRPSADWGTRLGVADGHSSDVTLARLASSQKGGGGVVRRSSISEYLTETIPGWKLDELMNLPDMGSMFNCADGGKADTPSSGDLDWAAELGVLDDDMLGESPAEVPSFPSPPTASGFPRPGRFGGSLKKNRRPDLSFFFDSDDILVVPDTGGQCSPALSPTSPCLKRRRAF